MKIAFTGAHGTGKTSVANVLAPAFNMIQAPSIQRELKKEGFQINRQATMLDQMMITTKKLLWESEHDNFIIDRHYYDVMAYTKYNVDNVWTEDTRFAYLEHYERFSNHWTKYDFVFYFPIYWPIVGDGVRETDLDYQDEIDSNIQYYMKDKFQGSFYTMPNASVLERAAYIGRVVRQKWIYISDGLKIARDGSAEFQLTEKAR